MRYELCLLLQSIKNWRVVRVVEGARLESVYTPKGYRGFESLTLRRKQYQKRSKARKSLISGLFYFTDLSNYLNKIKKPVSNS